MFKFNEFQIHVLHGKRNGYVKCIVDAFNNRAEKETALIISIELMTSFHPNGYNFSDECQGF